MKEKIYEDIIALIGKTFDISVNLLNRNSNMNTIPQWDSLGNLQLVYGIEEIFNITLEPEDIIKMTSVNSILSVLIKYLDKNDTKEVDK